MDLNKVNDILKAYRSNSQYNQHEMAFLLFQILVMQRSNISMETSPKSPSWTAVSPNISLVTTHLHSTSARSTSFSKCQEFKFGSFPNWCWPDLTPCRLGKVAPNSLHLLLFMPYLTGLTQNFSKADQIFSNGPE